MRRTTVIALLAVAPLFVTALPGNSTALSPSQRAAAQVAAREDRYSDGSLRKNRAELEDVLARTFIDTNAQGVTRDKSHEIEAIMNAPRLDSLTVQDRKIQIYGDVAVVTSQFTASGKAEGKPFVYVGRFTDVWSRQNGKWVCVAVHSSPVVRDKVKPE